MKLLALLFFFITTANAQVHGVESNYPEVAHPLIENYIQSGLHSGFYARYHIERHLKGVYFLPTAEYTDYLEKASDPPGCIGYDREGNVIILIEEEYLNQPEELKYILFHEINHLFGLPHVETPPDIMNPFINSRIQVDSETLEKMFRRIKEVPPINYMQSQNPK